MDVDVGIVAGHRSRFRKVMHDYFVLMLPRSLFCYKLIQYLHIEIKSSCSFRNCCVKIVMLLRS